MNEMLFHSAKVAGSLPVGFATRALPTNGPSGREAMGMLVQGTKLYILGGKDAGNLMDRWVFDFTNETWSRMSGDLPWMYVTTCKPSISGSRFALVGSNDTQRSAYLWDPTVPATYVNQFNMLLTKGVGTCGIYLPATGYYYGYASTAGSPPPGNMERVNPVTGGDTAYLANVTTTQTFGHQMTVMGGIIYMVGGHYGYIGSNATAFPSMHTYDRIGNSWSRINDAPDDRTGCAVEAIGSTLYRHGGRNFAGAENPNNYTDNLYSFGTAGWKLIGATGHKHQNAQSVVYNGKMYVFGGRRHNGTTIEYTNQFTEITVPS